MSLKIRPLSLFYERIPEASQVPLDEDYVDGEPQPGHGPDHSARVIVLGAALLRLTGHGDDLAMKRCMWGAAFLHDLHRTTGGGRPEPGHGETAARDRESKERLRSLFILAGFPEEENDSLRMVQAAVSLHDRGELPGTHHPHREFALLFRDANILDRVRFGDLDPAQLSCPESHHLIRVAENLLLTEKEFERDHAGKRAPIALLKMGVERDIREIESAKDSMHPPKFDSTPPWLNEEQAENQPHSYLKLAEEEEIRVRPLEKPLDGSGIHIP